jgi:hypothetical protein
MAMIGTAGEKRALSLCLSLSACILLCEMVWGNLNYSTCFTSFFSECVCYMFRARMFYTIQLELL